MTYALIALGLLALAATAVAVYTTVQYRRDERLIRYMAEDLDNSIPLRTPYQLEIDEPVRSLHTPLISGPDYTFAGPVQQCLCGSELFHALVSFDEDSRVAYYVLDGICHGCGATVHLPYETHEMGA